MLRVDVQRALEHVGDSHLALAGFDAQLPQVVVHVHFCDVVLDGHLVEQEALEDLHRPVPVLPLVQDVAKAEQVWHVRRVDATGGLVGFLSVVETALLGGKLASEVVELDDLLHAALLGERGDDVLKQRFCPGEVVVGDGGIEQRSDHVQILGIKLVGGIKSVDAPADVVHVLRDLRHLKVHRLSLRLRQEACLKAHDLVELLPGLLLVEQLDQALVSLKVVRLMVEHGDVIVDGIAGLAKRLVKGNFARRISTATCSLGSLAPARRSPRITLTWP